jgi:hypothetical protein
VLAQRRATEAEQAAERSAREAEQSAAALESVERRASDAEVKVVALSGEIAGLKTGLADSRQVGRAYRSGEDRLPETVGFSECD